MGTSNGNEAAKTLGAALRGYRVAHGLSMRALAKRVGLSAHGTLVDYEHGRRIPPEDLVSACEKALGVDDEHLQRLRQEALAELAGVRSMALLAASSPSDLPLAAPSCTCADGTAPTDAEPPVAPRPAGPASVDPAQAGTRWWTRRRYLSLGVVVVVVVLAAVLVAVAVTRYRSPATRSAPARPVQAAGQIRFGFETPADRWGIFWGRQKATGEITDSVHFEGTHAYAVTATGASEGHGPQNGYVAFGTSHGVETLHSGARVTVHMWTSYPHDGVRFFVYGPHSSLVWAPETPDNGSEVPVSGGTSWSTLTFTVPKVDVVTAIGVQPYAENDQPRVVAIDAVSW